MVILVSSMGGGSDVIVHPDMCIYLIKSSEVAFVALFSVFDMIGQANFVKVYI